MRIPTSVIVMSLVTAAPFAMAVRDTLHPQPKHHSYDDELSPEAETARYEAEMRREEEQRQAEEARKQAIVKTVLGDKGKLGPYLDNLTLGATREQAEAIQGRVANAIDAPVYVTFDVDAQDKVQSITVAATDCSPLRDQIRTQWGESTRWSDPAAHIKTTFDDGYDCALHVERYVEMEQFIDKTATASIPLGAIGKPATAVAADENLMLHTPGLEQTTGDTSVRLSTDDNGKIVGLSATFGADVEADAAIRARLDKVLGKGHQDPDTGEWDYKGRTPVHYAYTDAHVYIDIGQP